MDDMKKGGLYDGAGSESGEKRGGGGKMQACDAFGRYAGKSADEDNDKLREQNSAQSGKDGIKEQVKRAAKRLKGSPVLMAIPRIDVASEYSELVKRMQQQLSGTNGFVTRKGFGDVQVSSRLKGAHVYMKTDMERTAILAIPTIIEKGIELSGHTDHKNRGYSTFTFAGKVEIDGTTGIVAVVIKKTTDNFYKVHRVLTPDGKTLKKEAID